MLSRSAAHRIITGLAHQPARVHDAAKQVGNGIEWNATLALALFGGNAGPSGYPVKVDGNEPL